VSLFRAILAVPGRYHFSRDFDEDKRSSAREAVRLGENVLAGISAPQTDGAMAEHGALVDEGFVQAQRSGYGVGASAGAARAADSRAFQGGGEAEGVERGGTGGGGAAGGVAGGCVCGGMTKSTRGYPIAGSRLVCGIVARAYGRK
jgi:hypothetical protein